ncbi:MAG: lamin tail domain-containing protein [Bacteroidales bacterium]|nr:lamin tail domain-containing protein [Bacteroidales bacterium]
MKRRNTLTFGCILILIIFGKTSFAQTTLVSYALSTNGNSVDAQYVDSNPFTSSGTGTITYSSSGVYATGWPIANSQTDYYEITLNPESGYKLNITDLEFGERRSNTGIQDYQVRWSIDNFTTYTTIATINVPDNDSERSGNISGLNIDVNDGVSIKIRWYGYNAESSSGTWRINDNTLKVIGSIANANANDMDSRAEAPITQVSSVSIPSIVQSTASAVDVFKFKISDLGTSDGKPTKVTRIRVKKYSGSQLLDDWIKGFVLKEGSTNIIIASIDKANNASYFDLNINSGDLEIVDGSTKELTLGLYLESSVKDNKNFSFYIDADDNGFTADNLGSGLSTDFGTDVISNTITISVSATRIVFTVQPSSTAINNSISPSPKISYVDVTGSLDIDISGASNTIALSSSGTLDALSTTTIIPINGESLFPDIIHNATATAIHLIASSTNNVFSDKYSGNFNITSVPVAPTVDSIYISEVSAGPNTKTEFLELYNVSSDAIDLENCTLVRLTNSGTVDESFVLGNNNFSGDLIVNQGGYWVVSRGATRSEFEADWTLFTSSASFLKGNNNMYFGGVTAYRWKLTYDDGSSKTVTTIDDTQNSVGGSENNSNQITPGNWTTTSDITNGTPGAMNNNSELPIELISFNANQRMGSVLLQWQTATETNNDYFSIERSADAVHFDVIGKVNGAGNSNSLMQYHFVDKEVLSTNTLYYRLKQTDYDGAFTYSKMLSIQRDIKDFQIKNAHINGNSLTLSVNSPRLDILAIEIYSSIGQKVFFKQLYVNEGESSIILKLPKLSSGIYFIRLRNNNLYLNRKIFIK